MSVDLVSIIDTASGLAFLIILILAAFRGVELMRALANRIHRNRAFWIAALCVLLALQAQVPNGWEVGGLPIFELTFFMMVSVFFVFIDSTISVALEVDFFHRNTLRWRQARLIAYPIVFGWVVIFLSVTYLSGLPNPPAWVSAVQAGPVGLLFIATLLYSIVALVIGARRSPDMTLRRHILLLAAFFAMFIATTFMFNYTSTLSIDLISDALTVLSAYVLYRAVMTLSPLGRVGRETAAPSVSHSLTLRQVSPYLGSRISTLFVPAAAYDLYIAIISLSPVGQIEKKGFSSSKPAESVVILPGQS